MWKNLNCCKNFLIRYILTEISDNWHSKLCTVDSDLYHTELLGACLQFLTFT